MCAFVSPFFSIALKFNSHVTDGSPHVCEGKKTHEAAYICILPA